MTFLEPFLAPILAALVGSGITAGVAWFGRLQWAATILKFGGVIKRSYDILDPLLENNLPRWKGSDVQFAFELAIEAAADGKITASEVKVIAKEMAERWLPQVAADKVRKYSEAVHKPVELIAAQELQKVVDHLETKTEGLTETHKILFESV